MQTGQCPKHKAEFFWSNLYFLFSLYYSVKFILVFLILFGNFSLLIHIIWSNFYLISSNYLVTFIFLSYRLVNQVMVMAVTNQVMLMVKQMSPRHVKQAIKVTRNTPD